MTITNFVGLETKSIKIDKEKLRKKYHQSDVRNITPAFLHPVKICFVQPKIPDGNYLPNLGIMYLSALLIKNGYAVKVFDENLDPYFLEKLLEFKPDLVGFTCVTAALKHSNFLAGEIKKTMPQTLVIAGGPHPTAMPLETLREQKNFDFVFNGEAEVNLLQFCKSIFIDKKNNEETYSQIPGLTFRNKNGEVIGNRFAPFLEDQELTELPFPAWHLLPLEQIFSKATHGLFSKGKRIMPIMTTRGCPNYCGFCCRVLGFKFRKNDIEKVFAEILWLYENFNIDEVYFEDDTFTQDPVRAHQLLDGIIELNLPIYLKFANGLRADKVDRPLLEKMMKAGVYWVGFGIESGSNHTQALMRKFLDLGEAKKNVLLAKSMGLKVGSNCIIGYPGETKQSIKESLDYFLSLELDSFAAVTCVPFPGTTAWQVCEKNNWFTKQAQDYDNYWFEIFKVTPLIETEHLSSKDLSRAIFNCYIRFYFLNPKRFYRLASVVFQLKFQQLLQGLKYFSKLRWLRLLRSNSSVLGNKK